MHKVAKRLKLKPISYQLSRYLGLGLSQLLITIFGAIFNKQKPLRAQFFSLLLLVWAEIN